MESYCTECGSASTAATPHCPNCGAEDPWDERPAFRFDEDDLPFVFSHEVYDDNYDLWRTFCGEYFGAYELNGSDVAGLPEDFPKMKYCVFEVYFVITETYELEGPFLDKSAAREATA
jgi:hypothetical protein